MQGAHPFTHTATLQRCCGAARSLVMWGVGPGVLDGPGAVARARCIATVAALVRLCVAHPVAHSQSQRQKPRDIVISLDLLDVIMKDDFSVSVSVHLVRGHGVD